MSTSATVWQSLVTMMIIVMVVITKMVMATAFGEVQRLRTFIDAVPAHIAIGADYSYYRTLLAYLGANRVRRFSREFSALPIFAEISVLPIFRQSRKIR
jgi:hypothetical protein